MSQLNNQDFYELLPNPDRFDELDSDNMFELPTSIYYSVNEFNNILSPSDNSMTLSVMHFNIRSLPKNLDHLSECLSTFEHNIDIIGITENKT